MSSNCRFFKNCHVSYNVFTNQIDISRCCIKAYNPIAHINISEWEKIENKIEFLNTFSEVWQEDKNLRENYCERYISPETKECFSKEKIEKFIIFDIGIDTSCNKSCDFCYNKPAINFSRENHLESKIKKIYFDTLNNILQCANYPITIRLTDHGEPFFWQQDTINFLEKAELNPNISQVMATSNGVAFLNKSFYNNISKFKKLKVRCSINALSSTHYNKKMKSLNFNEIIKACDNLPQVETYSYIIETEEDFKDISENIEIFRTLTKKPIELIENYSYRPESLEILFRIKNNFQKFSIL